MKQLQVIAPWLRMRWARPWGGVGVRYSETAEGGETPQKLEWRGTDEPEGAVATLAEQCEELDDQVTSVQVPGVGVFTLVRPVGKQEGRVARKVAMVTGAGQGFGLGIAQELANEGACVVLADVNEKAVQREAEELNEKHGAWTALPVRMDVSDKASVRAGIEAVVRAYGGLDLLVSNAGVLRADSVKTLAEEDFDFVTRVNYKGFFLYVQGAAPVLEQQHRAAPGVWSDIVQINSKSGLEGSNRNGAYAGGKFGGIGLVQSFAKELVEDGVKVNAICPGNFFDGPLWSDPKNGLFVQYLETGKVPGAKTIDDVRRAYEAKVPMGRGCRVEDVMTALYYLVEQQYETGQALPVAGGQVMLH